MAFSCKDNKPKSVLSEVEAAGDSVSTGDSTVYGIMVEGGMNSIVLLTDHGDTLEYLVNPNDYFEVVKGGKIDGDRFCYHWAIRIWRSFHALSNQPNDIVRQLEQS